MGDRDQGSLSEFARPTLGSVKQRSRKGGQGRSSNGTSKAGTADPWSQASLELKRAYCSCVTDSGGSFTYINPECDRRFMTKLTHAFMPDVAHGIAQSFRHPILSTLDCKLDSVENLTTGELECKFLFDCKVKCLPNSFTDEPTIKTEKKRVPLLIRGHHAADGWTFDRPVSMSSEELNVQTK